MKILACLLFLLIQAALGDVIKTPAHFEKVGTIESFRWAPERYQNDFRYDIFYYIPKTIENASNVPALIFNHGGGVETMDRAGSIAVVKRYLPNLKRLADELGLIVVLPAANGLNWGGHTRGIVKDLAAMMRTELDIDANRIGLAGHSMGGMGITRSFSWMADEVNFFLPMAAGMDETFQTQQYLSKAFNVPYVHLQGLKDTFVMFVPRCQEQLKRTKALEDLYGVSSKLEITYFDGGHQYDYALFKANVQRLMKDSPRDLYQKELWGTFDITNRMTTENNISYHINSEARYFWLELGDSDETRAERINFHAKITGNRINISIPVLPQNSKDLKIYLHSEMVNLKQDVEIFLNGILVATRKAAVGELRVMDARDPGFIFEDAVLIRL